jgi:UDP-3-O-[3-hydroxymyristoyl] glucosamine N-acyltransferase
MGLSLFDIALLVDGVITGNADVFIDAVAKIEDAKEGELTFLYADSFKKFFPGTKASAILVKTGFEKTRGDITYIEVADPNRAFIKVLLTYFSPEFKLTGIDETAYIDKSASVGQNAAIGKNVVIGAGCKIGSNVKIFHNTVISDDVEIGDDTLIFQNVSIREKCFIGKRVIIHPGTVIGSDGFGYVPDANGAYIKIPQIGNVVIEDDVELGSNVSIDRAALGSTIVKKGTKIDNLVQVAHNVVIGEHTAISGQSGISGSSKLGSRCILAGQAGVSGHVELGDGVIVGAQSGVSKSLPKAGIYFGSPAKELKEAKRTEVHIRNLESYAGRIKRLEDELNKLKEKLS